MFDQIVWLTPRATAFTAVCEACAGNGASSESWLGATVKGTLHVEREHGTVMCPRGHVLRVERANHSPIGVLA